MSSEEISRYESAFRARNLFELYRSSWLLLAARRVRSPEEIKKPRTRLADLWDQLVFLISVGIPAIPLEIYQVLHRLITGKPRAFPQGFWQFYLYSRLREDLGHFTNETEAYHIKRPAQATDLDDLTAWVMTVIQFLWSYETIMGAVWDEWTLLRLVNEVVQEAGLGQETIFKRLQRQWELARPYNAPLNGTYADMRKSHFDTFIQEKLAALPEDLARRVKMAHAELAVYERAAFQHQMSLLARVAAGRFIDHREVLPLWDVKIGVIYDGRYYLIDVAAHDEYGMPVIYGPGGTHDSLLVQGSNIYTPDGEPLTLRGDQLYRERDGEWLGYLDMPPASAVKWQIERILNEETQEAWRREHAIDVILAETPRRFQRRLRKMLPEETKQALDLISRAPVIINWDEVTRDRTLAELRRTQRGIGDHPLTVIRTDGSFIFDQSHIFFDGAWSLAMAEVLTSAAVQWCNRCVTISGRPTEPARNVKLEKNNVLIQNAAKYQEPPELSAETTIYDISHFFRVRNLLLEKTGVHLTINDLLITTRIFHASHYRPSKALQASINEFEQNASTSKERAAVRAIKKSLQRGRILNPALLIPIDASPVNPGERLIPLAFRHLDDNVVWHWDEAWDAYQQYRKIDPPDTPEGVAAWQFFAQKREQLVESLLDFSHVLAASKNVALNQESLQIGFLKLMTYLPPFIQALIFGIAEYVPLVNELSRGDEVYSNVGRVAEGSSLSRFMSARDDGHTKILVWGIMTNNEQQMIITMRDFRPHVRPLLQAGEYELARQMAQNYVEAYTADLIGLVARLAAMLQSDDPRNL